MQLADKALIVTGSTTGVGAAIARVCVDQGARVLVHGRDEERGRELVERLGSQAVFHAEDLAEAFSQMVIAPSLKHRVYNSPCESVISEELGKLIQELNDQIDVNYSKKSVAGFPQVMNSNRIKKELHLSPHSIQNRMREYFYKGR